MGIWGILAVSILWSFVGIFVKSASQMVDSGTISFLRFFIGAIVLAIVYRIKRGPIRIRIQNRWIWTGALGKSANYFFENIAIILGLSYAYIIASPISYILLVCMAVFALKERLVPLDWLGSALALIGVVAIMLDGRSLFEMIKQNGLTNLCFVISGIGVAFHMFSQKKLAKTMDPLLMNLSVFVLCSFITAIPLPWMFAYKDFHLGSLMALLTLGLITGLSFYWFSIALRKVPLFLATVVSNGNVVFTVLWGVLFLSEPVSVYVIAGTVLFIIGMIVANWPKAKLSPTD